VLAVPIFNGFGVTSKHHRAGRKARWRKWPANRDQTVYVMKASLKEPGSLLSLALESGVAQLVGLAQGGGIEPAALRQTLGLYWRGLGTHVLADAYGQLEGQPAR
jgi:hypothetical protein